MNSKYLDIFETLIKSYYDGNFDVELTRLMGTHESSPQELFEVITSLCGVNIPYDNYYIKNLKKAITDYQVNKDIIKKLTECNTNCIKDTNGKSKCMLACPFDAIYVNENKKTVIDSSKCIHCGLCVDACTDGKIMDQIEFMPVVDLLKNNSVVIAAVAPAIAGQFGENVTMDQIRASLIKIGFTDMIEVAFAADMLTIKEACEFNKHVQNPKDLMITSCCCPMWVGMLKKVYSTLVKDLSPSVSPMIAAGRIIKKLNNEAKVVFIGPCVAKKAEAKEKDVASAIDFVLTFKELDDIFKIFKVKPSKLKGIPSKQYTSRGGRLYARTGGVSIAISEAIEELYPSKHKLFKAKQANGVIECKKLLQEALDGTLDANFLEGMGCVGGCVGGPKILVPPEEGKKAVDTYAYNAAIKVATNSEILSDIASNIGIESLEDFNDPTKIQILERNFNLKSSDS